MNKKIFTLAFCAFFGSSVFASTWNFMTSSTESVYYFDADTVLKDHEITTLWVKTVQMEKPDDAGNWAIASRWKINCSKQTIQTLAWTTYDKNGKYIRSDTRVGSQDVVVPDSMGESVLKVACEKNFPRDTSGAKYFKIKNNDVFQGTKDYVEYLKAHQDTAPQ